METHGRVRICDIAQELGLSTATVSNVLHGKTKKVSDETVRRVQRALEEIYPDQAGDFTQALMELGATVCGPNRLPDCENCPCKAFCQGHRNQTAANLPVKQPKKQRRREEMTVLILRCGERYALEKRKDEGLLAGLWQFPNLPGRDGTQGFLEQVEKLGLKPSDIYKIVEKKHIFTHVQWDMCGAYVEVKEERGGFVWLTPEQINRDTALPTAFRQFWEEDANV